MKRNLYKWFFVLFILLSGIKQIYPQWTNVYSPGSTNIKSFASSENILYASTTSGLYSSTNIGKDWIRNPDGGLYFPILTIFCLNSSIYLGGEYGKIVASTNNGDTWKSMSLGIPNSLKILTIYKSESHLYCGTSIGLYVFNGQSWVFSTDLFKEVSIFNLFEKNNYLFAATSNGIYKSTNNGIGWVSANSGIVDTNIISTSSDSNAIIASSDRNVYFSFNNGESWIHSIIGLPENLIIYKTYISKGKAYLSSDKGFFYSPNLGQSWSHVKIKFPIEKIMAIYEFKDKLFIGDEYLGVLTSDDGGIVWTTNNSGFSPLPFYSIYVNGSNVLAATSKGYVYTSNDNGNSWSPRNSIHASVNLTIVNKGDSIFVPTGEGIAMTSNFGESWSFLNNGIPTPYIYYMSVKNNNLMAGTSSGVYIMFNNETQWKKMGTLPLIDGVYSTVESGKYFFIGSEYNYIFRTVDSGKTWVKVNGVSSYNNSVHSLAAKDSLIYALRFDGVFLSTDYGDSWKKVFQGYKNYGVGGVSFIDSNLFHFVFSRLVLIKNFGADWVIVNDGAKNETIKAIAANDEFLFMATENGIWRRPLSEIISTSVENSKNDIPTNYQISQNYPNPFNPSTTITFSLPERSDVTITIYNSLGQQITQLVNNSYEPGTHTVQWNASSFSSGVYFYRMTAGNSTISKKMLLLK